LERNHNFTMNSSRNTTCLKKTNGELATLYKNSFSNLDGAERSGKNCTQSRVELVQNFKSDLTEQVDMLCDMLENTIQEKDEIYSHLCDANEQLDCLRQKLDDARKEIECLQEQKNSLSTKIGNLNTEMERMSIEATRELEDQDEELCKSRRHLEKLNCNYNKATEELDEAMSKLQQQEQQLRCNQSELCASQENNRQLELKLESYRRGHRFSNEEFHCKEEEVRNLSSALQESERENCTIKQKLSDISRGGFN